MHVAEDVLINQLKEKLSRFTIDPGFYKLAVEALAEQEDLVVSKDDAAKSSRTRAIDKAQQAITNLRRMRYNGEADDAWYFAEMSDLEDKIAKLQSDRNVADFKARNWREIADEVFSFARYAKQDFDGDDLEKKRTVIMRMAEELTILDRTIQFTPNKYLIPIEKMNENLSQVPDMVRTDSQQGEIGSIESLILLWLPIQVTELLQGSRDTKRDK
jgi:hypothetical protein